MSDKISALHHIDQVIARGPFAADWESIVARYQTPTWYGEGKFGIFIHWGPYCVPAFGNEWYPRNMYIQGEREFAYHQQVYGPQSKFGYKDFIPMFQAECFDADRWAALFKDAGAKFVVPVAEHHDGFAMYDCGFSRWTAAKMGPKRDVLGELSKAVRRQGMVVGASSHRAEHWFFFNGGRTFDSDVNDPQYDDFYGPAKVIAPEELEALKAKSPDRVYLDDWLVRTCEIVDKYRPQIMWFDWWIEQIGFAPYLRKFAAYYYNQAATWNDLPEGAAINFKFAALPEAAGVFDIERGQLKGIRSTLWQNDTSVSKNSWGYISHHQYKTATSIVHDLIDIVSKNGALLLNIGPRADGTIPEPEEQILREIGKWLAVNGDAIYGTQPWLIFGEGPTGVAEGSFTDTKRVAFTATDVRFTVRDQTLYAILMGWPDDGVARVKSLGGAARWNGRTIRDVRLLGSQAPVNWSVTSDELKVHLPTARPCDHAFVLEVSRQG